MSDSVSVYLAGKINKHGWRNELVHTEVIGNSDWAMKAMSDAIDPRWDIARNALGEGIHLSGPFFIGCDHGCGHGPGSHGITGGCIVTHASRFQTVQLCTQALEESDVVFAWLDEPDAYGTLVELGFAKGLGKRIIIAHPPQAFIRTTADGEQGTRDDMWFAHTLADVEIAAPSAKEAWAKALPVLRSPFDMSAD